jgi:hypothetical protein
MKPIEPSESLVELAFPLFGVDISTPFDSQPKMTTVDGVNVRGFEPSTQRDRGGSRPGLLRYLPQLVTTTKIQHINIIVDPQAAALIAPDTTETPGIDYIDDPSSNNLKSRNPPGRRIRKGGSGLQINKNKPSGTGTKKTPNIVWPTHGPVVQPYAITSAQLDAAAKDPVTGLPVAGTYGYYPPAGTTITADTIITVTFTPTDTATYNVATAAITLGTVTNYDGLFNGTGVCTAVSLTGPLFLASFTSVMFSIGQNGVLEPYPDISGVAIAQYSNSVFVGDAAVISILSGSFQYFKGAGS